MSNSLPGGTANGSASALTRPGTVPPPVIKNGGPTMDPAVMQYVQGPDGAGGVRNHTPLDAGAYYSGFQE